MTGVKKKKGEVISESIKVYQGRHHAYVFFIFFIKVSFNASLNAEEQHRRQHESELTK